LAKRVRYRSAKQELTERIVRVYPDLSPKKRRVADFVLKDHKRLFLMTAKELAQACGVSEPTIMRFAMDLGFSGYSDFEKFIKGLLHIELTAVERLNKTDLKVGDDSPLHRYCRNAVANLETLMTSVSSREQKRIAGTLFKAESILVVGYRASAALAQYFGYLLKKVRDEVAIGTAYSSELMDHIAVSGKGLVVFAIAFPRYPRQTIETMEYAKAMGAKVVGLSDAPTSPIVTRSDQYIVIDVEGISFIDPLEHILAFLASLVHEIAFMDQTRTVDRLNRLEKGIEERREYYSGEDGEDLGGTRHDVLNGFAETAD
jgi:DNA-binding MurR/RpiR family transcriptional regulator